MENVKVGSFDKEVFVAAFAQKLTELDILKSISAKSLDQSGKCVNGGAAHFVINQIENQTKAPSEIRVDDGSPDACGMSKFVGGVAHFDCPVQAPIKEATANIYEAWGGQFNLSSITCSENTKTATKPFVPSKTATLRNTETATETVVVTGTPYPGTGTPEFKSTATSTPPRGDFVVSAGAYRESSGAEYFGIAALGLVGVYVTFKPQIDRGFSKVKDFAKWVMVG